MIGVHRSTLDIQRVVENNLRYYLTHAGVPDHPNVQPTAHTGFHSDSTVATAISCRPEEDGDNGSGKCSQVNTADISDADNDDPPDETDVVLDRDQLVGNPLPGNSANGEAGGHSETHTRDAAVVLTGAVDGEPVPAPGIIATNESHEFGQNPHAAIGATIPWSKGGVEYPVDLFDVLEAWIFDHLRETLHAEFMLSGHFQEYTRFLHIQNRPVAENDFILFRVLGRGGFGAVNGE